MVRTLCRLTLGLGIAIAGGALAAQERPAPAAATPAAAQAFTWDAMLPVWIKMSKDFEYSKRQVESYLQMTRPDTWNEVRNNEFQLKKARTETLERLKKRVEECKADEDFVLPNAELRLGKYDFDLEAFPLENMTDTHYWYTSSDRYADALPGRFKVFFANTKAFALIRMDADKAEVFIKDRTDRYGDVNRATVASVRFKLKNLKDERYGEFLADIRSVTVYHDKTKTKALAELTPAAAAPPKP